MVDGLFVATVFCLNWTFLIITFQYLDCAVHQKFYFQLLFAFLTCLHDLTKAT